MGDQMNSHLLAWVRIVQTQINPGGRYEEAISDFDRNGSYHVEL